MMSAQTAGIVMVARGQSEKNTHMTWLKRWPNTARTISALGSRRTNSNKLVHKNDEPFVFQTRVAVGY